MIKVNMMIGIFYIAQCFAAIYFIDHIGVYALGMIAGVIASILGILKGSATANQLGEYPEDLKCSNK